MVLDRACRVRGGLGSVQRASEGVLIITEERRKNNNNNNNNNNNKKIINFSLYIIFLSYLYGLPTK